jgi:ribokinase
MIEVTLFGDVNVDALMSIPSYPSPGGDSMAQQVILRPGGSVANTAIVLARLGVKTKMIARVGDDRWADMALEPLINLEVDVSAVQRDPTDSTGLIFIPVTHEGERTMFSYRGANTRMPVEAITAQALGQPRFLHLSAYNFLTSPQREATWKAVELAKEAGIPISMDIGVEPSRRVTGDRDCQIAVAIFKQHLLALLPDLALVVLGREEAQNLVGSSDPETACAALGGGGLGLIGLKLGKDGCYIASNTEQYFLPGFTVDTVDTTGAGDAFCAGMLFGRLAGISLPASGLLANALGALATTVWGGGPVLPGKAEVTCFLQEEVCRKPGDDRKKRDSGQSAEFLGWREEILSALMVNGS